MVPRPRCRSKKLLKPLPVELSIVERDKIFNEERQSSRRGDGEWADNDCGILSLLDVPKFQPPTAKAAVLQQLGGSLQRKMDLLSQPLAVEPTSKTKAFWVPPVLSTATSLAGSLASTSVRSSRATSPSNRKLQPMQPRMMHPPTANSSRASSTTAHTQPLILKRALKLPPQLPPQLPPLPMSAEHFAVLRAAMCNVAASSRRPSSARSEASIPTKKKARVEVPPKMDCHEDTSSLFKGTAGPIALPKSLSKQLHHQDPNQTDPPTTTITALPTWSLVGSFRCGLTTAVRATGAALKWTQRNPSGGHQTLVVNLSDVTNVLAVKMEEGRSYCAVIRTSSKPSQITFGFEAASEMTKFRTALLIMVKRG